MASDGACAEICYSLQAQSVMNTVCPGRRWLGTVDAIFFYYHNTATCSSTPPASYFHMLPLPSTLTNNIIAAWR